MDDTAGIYNEAGDAAEARFYEVAGSVLDDLEALEAKFESSEGVSREDMLVLVRALQRFIGFITEPDEAPGATSAELLPGLGDPIAPDAPIPASEAHYELIDEPAGKAEKSEKGEPIDGVEKTVDDPAEPEGGGQGIDQEQQTGLEAEEVTGEVTGGPV